MSDPTENWDWRWMCTTCGRFLATSAVREDDHLDPDAYYGIRSEVSAKCGRCGWVEPTLRPVRELSTPPELSAS